MGAREEALGRIRKLAAVRQGRGATAAEEARARALAASLMARHEISADEVEGGALPRLFQGGGVRAAERVAAAAAWEGSVARSCAAFYRCEASVADGAATLSGDHPGPWRAAMAAERLMAAARKGWAASKRSVSRSCPARQAAPAIEAAFYEGFADGVAKTSEGRPEGASAQGPVGRARLAAWEAGRACGEASWMAARDAAESSMFGWR